MNKKGLVRKILVYSVYILFIACFQVSFPDKLTFGTQIADLMFVFVALVSYYFGLLDGIVVGLIVGLLRDAFAAPAVTSLNGSTVSSVGIGAFVMFAVAVFCANAFTFHMHRKFSFAMISVISSTVIYKLLGHIVIKLWTLMFSQSSYNLSLQEVFIDSLLVQLVLNIIVALPLILLLRFAGPYSKGVNPSLIDDERGGRRTWLTI